MSAFDVLPHRRAGTYTYCVPNSGTTTTAATPPNGELSLAAFPLIKRTTLIRVGMEIVNAGVTGAGGAPVYKIVICGSSDGYPHIVYVDSSVHKTTGTGLIDGLTTGVQEVQISVTLAAGVYWAGAVLQGAPGTAPDPRLLSQAWMMPSLPSVTAGENPIGVKQTGVTGTVGSFSSSGVTATVPRVYIKT